MSVKHVIVAIAVALGLLLLALAVHGWLAEHDARLKAESETASQQKQIAALQQSEAQIEAGLNAQVATIEKQKATPATAKQVVTSAAPLFAAPLPEPIQVVTAAPNPATPNAPAAQTVVIPESDFKAIRDAELTCQENGEKLAACTSTTQNQQQQLALTAKQRDEWETTAKGGTFWHRFGNDLKWLGIGAGVGVAGGYAIGHHK